MINLFLQIPKSVFCTQQRRALNGDLPMGQQGQHQEITVSEEGREFSGMGSSWALTLMLQAHRTEHWPETGRLADALI